MKPGSLELLKSQNTVIKKKKSQNTIIIVIYNDTAHHDREYILHNNII